MSERELESQGSIDLQALDQHIVNRLETIKTDVRFNHRPLTVT